MNYFNVLIATILLSFSSYGFTKNLSGDDVQLPDNLKGIFPSQAISSISFEKEAGLYVINIVGGASYLATSNGGYLIKGEILKVSNGRVINLREEQAKKAIINLPNTETINYPSTAKFPAIGTITVIADVTCEFCALFHEQIPAITKQGVNVRYLPYPRAGLGSDAEDKNSVVWCAKDPNRALDYAFKHRGSIDPSMISGRKCNNVVERGYEAGQRLKIVGTPFVLLSNGVTFPGTIDAKSILGAFGG